jgi:signal transduction histidine kinase
MATETPEERAGRLQRELDQAKAQLAASGKWVPLGRLSASVIHEINTPVGSIVSNNDVAIRTLESVRNSVAELAAKGQAPGERVLQQIEVLAGLASVDRLACERILGIVRSWKTFARVEEEGLHSVNLNDVVRDAVRLSQFACKGGVAVETRFEEIPNIDCYPQRLSQVFLNLLMNAVQAIQGAGSITVRTGQRGASVVVAITDTGSGIAPGLRGKLFAEGFTTKPPGVGTGLGLAISRKIVVEDHGGSIELESEPGRGSTFTVSLPIVRGGKQ